VVIVPDHAELARGTLKSTLRQANITGEDFLKLLYIQKLKIGAVNSCIDEAYEVFFGE
jgi:hypothetical protein